MFPNGSQIDLWDKQLFELINATHNGALNAFMLAISRIETWFPVYALLLFWLYRKMAWKQLLLFIACFIAAFWLSNAITSDVFKPIFERYRPCQPQAYWGYAVHLVGKCGSKYGFASSHSSNFFAMASMIFFLDKRLKVAIIAYFCAFLVAYSRIYLGVHFPLDVIVGAIIGILSAVFCLKIFYELRKRLALDAREMGTAPRSEGLDS